MAPGERPPPQSGRVVGSGQARVGLGHILELCKWPGARFQRSKTKCGGEVSWSVVCWSVHRRN